MCGYARRHISNQNLEKFLKSLDLMVKMKSKPQQGELLPEHFYPAFGGAASRQITGLIIQEAGVMKAVDATWWFDCQEVEGDLVVNNKRTTFNARNLVSPYWKGAIRHHRGIAVITALGEGKVIDGKNKHFFVEGETPLLMGAVYRPFSGRHYSTAIITRDSHSKFDKYHDKAFPLFLPPDPAFLKLWLSDEPETHPEIAHLLANPKVFNNLKITQVKTFKDAVPLGLPEFLEPDTDMNQEGQKMEAETKPAKDESIWEMATLQDLALQGATECFSFQNASTGQSRIFALTRSKDGEHSLYSQHPLSNLFLFERDLTAGLPEAIRQTQEMLGSDWERVL